MEESTREVVSGSELADEAGKALLAIDTVLAQLAQRIGSISSATTEQAQASTRIAQTMQDIFQVTTQTHESTQDAVERVTYLDQLASRLRTSVATFKLPDDQAA
jgi:twitching motility protein PilJ